jgi:uncharacterized membrane protein
VTRRLTRGSSRRRRFLGVAFAWCCSSSGRQNGFLVAIGTFLSFDMILFHWVFQLHRLTSGPEANVLEPFFVLLGVVFIVIGLRRERSARTAA